MSTTTVPAPPRDADASPPRELRGVRRATPQEERLQRRWTLAATIAPFAGLVFAVVMLWGWGITWLDIALFGGFYVFTGLGITVGYHRLFTHRSFDAPRPVRWFFAVGGSMAVQGAVTDWVANHRRHHAYSDDVGDPHSPHLVERPGLRGVIAGLWHAHIGWLFTPAGTDRERWAPDLVVDPTIARVNRQFPLLAVLSFVLPPIIAFAVTRSFLAVVTGFVWGSLVRIFLLHHVTWSINSICHFFGRTPFRSRDESRNNWPLAVLSFGESWHNNHHAFPTSARHGLLRGQFDLSWVVVRTLQVLRLARSVHLPTPAAMERKRAVAELGRS